MTTIDTTQCRFEAYRKPLSSEYGADAGTIQPGVRVTYLPTGAVAENNTFPNEANNRAAALGKLAYVLATEEQQALADALNATGLGYDDRGYSISEIGRCVEDAASLLSALKEQGWSIEKTTMTAPPEASGGRGEHLSEEIR